jgi:glycerol kinase
MQRLADLLDAPVDRPMIQETTALGAAYLAGLAAGVYLEPTKFADNWRLAHRIKPAMSRPRARSEKCPVTRHASRHVKGSWRPPEPKGLLPHLEAEPAKPTQASAEPP